MTWLEESKHYKEDLRRRYGILEESQDDTDNADIIEAGLTQLVGPSEGPNKRVYDVFDVDDMIRQDSAWQKTIDYWYSLLKKKNADNYTIVKVLRHQQPQGLSTDYLLALQDGSEVAVATLESPKTAINTNYYNPNYSGPFTNIGQIHSTAVKTMIKQDGTKVNTNVF